jgi:sRNA-binding protein
LGNKRKKVKAKQRRAAKKAQEEATKKEKEEEVQQAAEFARDQEHRHRRYMDVKFLWYRMMEAVNVRMGQAREPTPLAVAREVVGTFPRTLNPKP